MQAQQLKREVQRRLGVDIQTNQYEDVSDSLQTALRSLRCFIPGCCPY